MFLTCPECGYRSQTLTGACRQCGRQVAPCPRVLLFFGILYAVVGLLVLGRDLVWVCQSPIPMTNHPFTLPEGLPLLAARALIDFTLFGFAWLVFSHLIVLVAFFLTGPEGRDGSTRQDESEWDEV